MVDLFHCDDADWLVMSTNTPARMAKGAVQQLRNEGVKAGLFRPITLWPFPIDAFAPLMDSAKGIIVAEAGSGQLEDEMRLALSHTGRQDLPPIHRVQHFGGVLPGQQEIVDKVRALEEESHG
jgi:pyruvate/2-oxoacid:ferredoxin oxidoreductase alpha subunit